MWIERDLSEIFTKLGLLEAILIQGPRQVGKSSFLERYAPTPHALAVLDDLSVRTQANSDPALFFTQHPPPVVIDEFQYAPVLLPEIKLRIDHIRRLQRSSSGAAHQNLSYFYLSGSNQIQIDQAVRESLAGRVSKFTLHGLSVHEIVRHFPKIQLPELLWKGGFPELYVRPEISPRSFLNDYISTFIENDIARSSGISKIDEFLTVVRLLAARVGGILNRDSLANDAGVASKTVSEWIDALARMHVMHLLPVYSSNLNSRLTKAPKLYFLDSGLATRLQGHLDVGTILGAPQAGGLFENLAMSEVVKARDHLSIPCELAFWRTKDGEELDLIVTHGGKRLFFEFKLAVQGNVSFQVPRGLIREFGEDITVAVVTAGGTAGFVSHNVLRVPIFELGQYLKEQLTDR